MKIFRIILSLVLTSLVLASLVKIGVASAEAVNKEGYWTDSSGKVIRSGSGLCWRSGYWTKDMAIEECDPDLIKKEKPVEPKKAPPPPLPPPPPPPPPPEPPPPVVQQEAPVFLPINMQAETLFDFDKSVLHADGKKILNEEVVAKMKEYPQVEEVSVTGHADRIGKAVYNHKLSQHRAEAVKAYLVEQGIDAKRIKTVAKGGNEPLATCTGIKGAANRKNKKLVECLRPNRRVVVEISVQRPAQ